MIQEIIKLQGRILVAEDYVRQHVPASSYANGISRYEHGLSKRWEYLTVGSTKYIVYDLLTKKHQERLGDVHKLLMDRKIQVPELKKGGEFNPEIALVLDFTYSQERFWEQYYPYYRDRYFTREEIMLFGRMHAFIEALIGLNDEGYSQLEIYNTFRQCKKKYKLYNFKVNNFKYFSDKLKNLKDEGIETLVYNQNRYATKDGVLSSKYIVKQITKKFIQQPVLTYAEIVEHVNHEIEKKGYEPIKIWAVKELCGKKNTEFRNTYMPFRMGKTWADKHLNSYLIRAAVKTTNAKWEIDGTVLPFYVRYNNKVTRFWIEIIVCVGSRKIISWAIGVYETRYLVFEAYRLAILNTQVLPFEVCRDNAGAYNTPLIAEFETALEEEGVLIRPCAPGKSTDKGTVEKIHDILCTKHFSKYSDCFIGSGGWKSDRELYRVESADLKELRKWINVKEVSEIYSIVSECVTNYNLTPF